MIIETTIAAAATTSTRRRVLLDEWDDLRDELHAMERAALAYLDALDVVRRAPVLTLTEDEINMLHGEGQEWARRVQAHHAREAACPKHERVSTSSYAEDNRGDHRGHCRNCGKNMDQDSGD